MRAPALSVRLSPCGGAADGAAWEASRCIDGLRVALSLRGTAFLAVFEGRLATIDAHADMKAAPLSVEPRQIARDGLRFRQHSDDLELGDVASLGGGKMGVQHRGGGRHRVL